MVERQGGEEFAHRIFVFSVQRIAMRAVHRHDSVVHSVIAVVRAVGIRVQVGDVSVVFVIVGVEGETPGIIELIIDVQERVDRQAGKAGCREGGPYERKIESQIPFVQVTLVVRFEIQVCPVPDRIEIARYAGRIVPGQAPLLAQESEGMVQV